MRHVLFVDDDPAYLGGIERLLHAQKNKWTLHFTSSTDEALDCLKEHPVDLIVSDILMPGKSGMDLLAAVKKNKATENLPVIMVTGQIDSKKKLKALKMGAADLLNKPFDEAELLARIENCLKLKIYQDRIIDQNLALEDQVKDRAKFAHLVKAVNAALVKEVTLESLLQQCCRALIRHLDAAFARIWILDSEKNRLELKASAGMYTHLNGDHQYIQVGDFKIGRIAETKTPVMTNSVVGDPEIHNQEWAEKEKIVSFAGHPLVIKKRLVGVLAMFSKNRLNDSTLETFSSISDGIALGIVQKKSDDKTRFYSLYDTLTMLPNRRFFWVFLGKMIHSADSDLKRFALVLVDIDDFNRINESLGHSIGDKCLKIFSQRMLTTLQASESLARLSDEAPPVARLDGDEFALLLEITDDIQRTNHIIHRLLEALSKSMVLTGRELILSASIGIAIYPDDGNSIADLFKNAETALYHAKEKGKSSFAFYSQSMNIAALEMLDLEINLRQAIEKKELHLYYQPKVALDTNTIIGAEALIRWETAEKKMISPGQFIPLAENSDLILPIGDWVVETACRQNMAWQKAGMEKIPLAVNISGRQFGQKNFIEKITRFLDASGLAPEYLELEITETMLMMNPDNAIEDLKALKKLGIKISLDDFGTGYSSLAYLQKLPIDQLKIDLSFIKNVLSNPNDAVMVKAIVSMAHNLNLSVIAEGVEDIRQLEYLAALGCDIIQGYLFSAPLPASEFAALLKDSSAFPQLTGPAFSNTEKDHPATRKGSQTISFHWSDAFCIGEETIDSQHQKWFAILHDAQNKLLGNLKCTVGSIGQDALKEMFDYTTYHFSYEEAYLKKMNFPEFTHHKKLHDALVKKLKTIQQDLDSGKKILTSQIIHLMETWFIEHILMEDHKFKQ